MNWIYAVLIAFSLVNFASIMLVFYYVNRNWERLIELTNYLNNIDRQNWRNTEQLADIRRKIGKEENRELYRFK